MFRLLQILISILVVVSLIRSVARAIQGFFGNRYAQTRMQPESRPGGAMNTPTALQQDPVCGTYVSVDSSLKKLHAGRVIHFCSPECRDRYTA